MIKILVPDDPENSSKYDVIVRFRALESLTNRLDRPSCIHEEDEVIYLSDRLHYWLKNNNIEYRLSYEKETTNISIFFRWYIIFESKDEAMLFKLTWY